MGTSRTANGLRWAELQARDLDAMHALHQRSLAGFGPDAVKPERREFLDSLLRGRGRVLGAWQDEQLVAYGVLQHDLTIEDRLHGLLGLPADQPLFKLAGAAVDVPWRGQRLQRELTLRRLAWADSQAVFATAAPSNPASWRSLLACGLSVRDLQYRYGGRARYLLARVPDEHFVIGPASAQELGPDALLRQQQLFAQGWRGLAPGAARDHLCLLPCRS